MKRTIILLVLFVLSTNQLLAQQSSFEMEKLAVTAKVWGFLKYYHPAVAKGDFNWDQQLFQVLEKVSMSNDKDEFSVIMLNWITSLGKVDNCKKCQEQLKGDVFEENFNLNWIDTTSLLTNSVSESLRNIEQNRHLGKQYYVTSSQHPFGRIEFTNELDYENFDWQDQNFRLLTLFRYWNQIEYFFPYKYQTDRQWDEVLMEMIPVFLYSKSLTDFHLAILELTVSIDDSHTAFMTKEIRQYFGTKFFPVSIRLIEDRAIVTAIKHDSLAAINDFKIGDEIIKVGDKSVLELYDENEKYIAGSNQNRKKTRWSSYVFIGNLDTVNLTIIRNNEIIEKTVFRYDYSIVNQQTTTTHHEKYKMLDDNIGYVNMGELEVSDIEVMMEDFKNTKGIILDLRHYPKQTASELASYFYSRKRAYCKMLYPILNYPGKFIFTKPIKIGRDGRLKYQGDLVLLANEYSLSQSEYSVMLLEKADHAITIGSQTAGADGPILAFKTVGGYDTRISGLGVFYEDGTETQRVGVKIDIEVIPTIEGLMRGKDEVLEKAVEYINR